MKAALLAGDEFKNMEALLDLCEGARVLLTRNLWVEAGLNNGAMGIVLGFVWPVGGDPSSEKSELRTPLCVVVKFDELDLGVDAAGRARAFFRTAGGEPDPAMAGCVPIFASESGSESYEGVYREQFPLILAYALTHWKAQGMTLAKARIQMGARIAGTKGAGFTITTRVKHPSQFMYETELPSYEAFEQGRYTRAFRESRRWALHLEAKASRTIRKYGFLCRVPGHAWSREEAALAEQLEAGLRNVRRRQQEVSRGRGGRWAQDSFIWADGDPDVATELARVCLDQARGDADLEGHFQAVARRLLGDEIIITRCGREIDRNRAHLPALREALGCLVPKEFDPYFDKLPPKGKVKAVPEQTALMLTAGSWRVNIFDEQGVTHGSISKGVVEIFALLARRICEKLSLPIFVGSVELGRKIAKAADPSVLAVQVGAWKGLWDPDVIRSARCILLPVCFDDGKSPRDWAFVAVTADSPEKTFALASSLRAHVFDRIGRVGHVDSFLLGLRAVVATVCSGVLGRRVDLEHGAFPQTSTPHDVPAVTLGLLLRAVGIAAAEPVLDDTSELFAVDVVRRVRAAYQALRAQAERTGERDILRQFVEPASCRAFLRRMGEAVAVESCPVAGDVTRRVLTAVDDERWVVLTWNISGAHEETDRWKSAQAPPSWSYVDQLSTQVNEILRWRPHLLALQECPGALALCGLSAQYGFVGAVKSHCGYTHLYALLPLVVDILDACADHQVLLARAVLGRTEVGVVAAHLPPYPEGGAARKAAVAMSLRKVKDFKAVLVIGDLNVRQDEVVGWREDFCLREAMYDGFAASRHPIGQLVLPKFFPLFGFKFHVSEMQVSGLPPLWGRRHDVSLTSTVAE